MYVYTFIYIDMLIDVYIFKRSKGNTVSQAEKFGSQYVRFFNSASDECQRSEVRKITCHPGKAHSLPD